MEHRSHVEKYIKKRYREILFDKQYENKYVKYLIDTYKQNADAIMDYIIGRIDISSTSDFDIYVMLEGLDHLDETNYCAEYFSKDEIKEYKKEKYKQKDIKFPIVIPCIPVTSDQWIGAVSSKFYMKLRDSKLIRYNTEAQRVMRPIKNRKDGIEVWSIAVNKTSVKEISEQMKEGTYIPDEITLNIPEGEECDISYINGELIIDKIDHFDISDGYHRYLAMSNLYGKDPDFDYPMEIRIINYSLTKVKRFIHQKDQKTKMSKIDSDSMNMDSFANVICEQLNTNYGSSMFILHGKINRNNGAVRLPELSKIIEYFYSSVGKNGVRNRKKKLGLKETISLREEIKEGLNKFFIDIYPKDIENDNVRVDYQDLLLCMYIIRNDLFSCYDNNTLRSKYDHASKVIHLDENKKYFITRTPRAKQIELIEGLLS